MRTGFLLVLIVLLIIGGAAADTWEHTFGSDLPEQAFFSLVTEDGGLLICAIFIIDVSYSIISSESAGGVDCILVRIDDDQEILWEADYFSGPWPDLAVAGVETEDGCFVLAGITTTMEEGQRNWLFKVDDTGQIIWESSPGTDYDDWTYDMIETGDDGFVLAGYVEFTDGTGRVVSLFKTDSQGDELWNRQYTAAGSGTAEALLETSGGDLLITGYLQKEGEGNVVPFLLRTDSGGNEIWMKTISGQHGNCFALDMTMKDNGNIILAGYTVSSAGDYDFWIAEMTTDGELVRQSVFGGKGDDMAFTAAPCPEGCVVAGFTASQGAGRDDIWILCIDDSGEEVWSVTHGGPGNECAEDIIPAAGGGFIVSGYTSSWGAGDTDIWILKVDEEGQLD